MQALTKLEGLAIDGSEPEVEALVHDALLKRLEDDSFEVVLQALGMASLLTIPAAALYEALAGTLRRGLAALIAGGGGGGEEGPRGVVKKVGQAWLVLGLLCACREWDRVSVGSCSLGRSIKCRQGWWNDFGFLGFVEHQEHNSLSLKLQEFFLLWFPNFLFVWSAHQLDELVSFWLWCRRLVCWLGSL